MISLRAIDENAVMQLEEHVTKNPGCLSELSCCFSDFYKNQDAFSFMPGHKAAILGIPRRIEEIESQKSRTRKRKLRTLDDLQAMLIAQLNAYPAKIGFVLPEPIVTERNLVNVNCEKQADDSLVVDCGFSCPFCAKVSNVKFKKYWWTSNATRHLKMHVVEQLTRHE